MKIIVRIILLVAFVGLVVIGVWYLHGKWVWRHAWQLTVLFDSGTMPQPNTPVLYRGINVGKVKAVRFPPDSKKVGLVLFLKPEVPLRSDATVSLAQEGLFGERHVEIASLGDKGSALKSGDTITGVPERDLDILPGIRRAIENTDEMVRVAADVMKRLDDLEKRVARLEVRAGKR